MPDSEAKRAWMKKFTAIASVKLNRNTDADIFEYYNGEKPTAADIKEALREYIRNHKKT